MNVLKYFFSKHCRKSDIINDIWSEARPTSTNEMYLDVMVSPVNLGSFNEAGIRHRWKLYVMIPNVQKLIDKSANFKDYSKTGSANEILDEGIQIFIL